MKPMIPFFFFLLFVFSVNAQTDSLLASLQTNANQTQALFPKKMLFTKS